MRRPPIALVAAVSALLVAISAAVAVTVARQPDDAPGHRGHGMIYSSSTPRGEHWNGGWRMGASQWMHGALVDSEFEYLIEMVAHHEEAVASAQQLSRSNRPQIRAFGESIVATQSAQIDQMRVWLADWYPGQSTDVTYQPMMRDLSGLSGDRLDREFLRDMIWHHMAAVMMSQQLLTRDLAKHHEVNTLARSIRDDQHAEIFKMRRWLSRWYNMSWRDGRGWNDWDGGGWGNMPPGTGPA